MPFRPPKAKFGELQNFFWPPPLKKNQNFFITFLHLSGYFKTFKKKFRLESLKARRKFFRPPLKRVENFLAPPKKAQWPSSINNEASLTSHRVQLNPQQITTITHETSTTPECQIIAMEKLAE